MRKVAVVSKIFEDRKKKKNRLIEIVVVVVVLLALAVVAFANEIAEKNIDYVTCEFFATKDNYTEFSSDFVLKVNAEQGFLWNLENGMTDEQKNILLENAKKFYKNKFTANYDAAGMICRDNTNAKVSIIIEK